MKVTIFTRFWMCCVLFAASVVNSLAADRLVIIGDAVWGGWCYRAMALSCRLRAMMYGKLLPILRQIRASSF